ncbi:MAG: Holliday junction branch migration protein RuvA [Methylocystaceae bacterium]|nr:Holliday junction branch migration protein RuvA [Methylocystaceae bacterium]
MIGKLKGAIDSLGEDFVILDVHGVGYVVHCSQRTLQKLPQAGEAATLAIETQVREDSIKLFGFDTQSERDWFRLLQSVQGVGAKVALAILSILTTSELASAIATQQQAVIGRAPGVGPKLAARIMSELKDKASSFITTAPTTQQIGSQLQESSISASSRDAISALVNLGYGRPQCVAAVAASVNKLGVNAETGALIRQGLKELAT